MVSIDPGLSCARCCDTVKQGLVETETAASAAVEAKASGAELSEKQADAIEEWKEELNHAMPTAEDAEMQRDWHSGSYWNAVKGQFGMSYETQWTDAPRWLLVDMIPFMLIGIVLLRLGVLGAQRSARTHLLMMLGGYAVGVLLGFHEMGMILDGNFSVVCAASLGMAVAQRPLIWQYPSRRN